MSNNANTNTKETSSVNPFQAEILMRLRQNRDRLNRKALSGELNTVNRVSDENRMYLGKQSAGMKRGASYVPRQITQGRERYEGNYGENDNQVMQEDDYQSVLAALKAQELKLKKDAALKAAAEADKQKKQAEIKEKKKKKRQEILMKLAPYMPFALMILLLIVLTIFMIFAIAALFEL